MGSRLVFQTGSPSERGCVNMRSWSRQCLTKTSSSRRFLHVFTCVHTWARPTAPLWEVHSLRSLDEEPRSREMTFTSVPPTFCSPPSCQTDSAEDTLFPHLEFLFMSRERSKELHKWFQTGHDGIRQQDGFGWNNKKSFPNIYSDLFPPHKVTAKNCIWGFWLLIHTIKPNYSKSSQQVFYDNSTTCSAECKTSPDLIYMTILSICAAFMTFCQYLSKTKAFSVTKYKEKWLYLK